MKNYIKKILIMGAFLMPISSSALPVTDWAQLFENGQTVLRWTSQISQWKDELTNWKKDYDAITGFKLEGDIMGKFTQLNATLKQHGLDMGDLDLNNPKSQIGVYAKQLFETYTVYDDCIYTFLTEKEKNICAQTVIREVQEIATVSEFSKSVNETLGKLSDLNTQLENSKDTKTTQDITAAMESTFSNLEMLSSKFEMLEMRNRAKAAIDKRQERQIYMKKFDNIEKFVRGTL